MSSYKDAELMMATQVAYLNYSGNGRNSNENVGDLVDSILLDGWIKMWEQEAQIVRVEKLKL